MKKIFIVATLFLTLIHAVVVADYRMDECYWLDNAAGVIDDVKDTTVNQSDGTSHGLSATYLGTLLNTAPICMASNFNAVGDFVDVPNNVSLTTSNTFSFSFWMRPNTPVAIGHQLLLSKTINYADGFSVYTYWSGAFNYLLFQLGNGVNWNYAYTTSFVANQWTHVSGTYDGLNIKLYVNGALLVTTPYALGVANVNNPLLIGQGVGGFYQYSGALDEVKLYNHTLTALEVNATYSNELAGKDYNGTLRVCPTCDANTTAGIWGLVGVPADLRTAVNKDVANVFDEFNASSYNVPANADGWVVFKRDYNATNNASSSSIVPYTGLPLQFGQGYWLLSKVGQTWSENGLPNVDYNSTNPNCITNRCVEIDLTSVNLNFGAPNNDPNDGSGKNRNNMLGFVGHTPVNWADCRFLINGVSYTPTDANLSGFADKQVWQYNPGAGGADANGYTTCNDVTPGGCKLEPYKGFWVILHGTTKNKTVKLLIPKE